MLLLGSNETDAINNSDIYVTYREFYLGEKEREEKLVRGIQLVNDYEYTTKNTFEKMFAIPLEFDFFKRPVYIHGHKEDLIE